MSFVPLGDVLTNSGKNSFHVITTACTGSSVPSQSSPFATCTAQISGTLLAAMIDLFPSAWLIISWFKIDTSLLSGGWICCYGLVMFSLEFRECCCPSLRLLEELPNVLLSFFLFEFKVHLLNESLALLPCISCSSSAWMPFLKPQAWQPWLGPEPDRWWGHSAEKQFSRCLGWDVFVLSLHLSVLSRNIHWGIWLGGGIFPLRIKARPQLVP